tara:strand:- start:763 stop:1080 length:318 start_codon:yes stop_codon:yes gene_type:complete
MNIVETYAPTLNHLEKQLRPHDPVILSWTAGPQPGSTSDIWGTEPFILIQVEDPYKRNDEPDTILIRSETDCVVFSDFGETYSLTFQNVLEYLWQLPRPLWSFAS